MMKKEKQKRKEVSVIIPSYNCGKYLTCAIQSVMQQKIDLEIILIDDASVDGTEEVVKKIKESANYPIFYVRNSRNLGVSASRNKGAELAEGKYIAWLDADDWWAEGKLEKQLNRLKQTNGVFCYTGRELCYENGQGTGKKIPVPEEITFHRLLHTNVIPCSSVLLKTEIAREFPMAHDEIHEDYLTWLRIVQKYGQAYGINEPLLKSRLTAGGKSRNKGKTLRMTYGVYRYMGIKSKMAVLYTIRHLCYSLLRYVK